MVVSTRVLVRKLAAPGDLSGNESLLLGLRAPYSFDEFCADTKTALPSVTHFVIETTGTQLTTPVTADNFCQLVEAGPNHEGKHLTILALEGPTTIIAEAAESSGAGGSDTISMNVSVQSGVVEAQEKNEPKKTDFGSDEDFCYLPDYGASVQCMRQPEPEQVKQDTREGQQDNRNHLHAHERPQFNHHHHHGPPHHHHGHPHHGPPHHRQHNTTHHHGPPHHGPPHHGPPHHGLPHHGPPHRGHRHHRGHRGHRSHGGRHFQRWGEEAKPHCVQDVRFSCKEEKTSRKAMLRFVKHATLEDGAEVQPGAELKKVWEVRNDSTFAWPEHCHLVSVGGDDMFAKDSPAVAPVGALLPGYSKQIGVTLRAPSKHGRYKSFWRLSDANGKKFGQRLWCQIVVRDATSSVSSSSSSSSSSTSSSSSSDSEKDSKRISKRQRRERKSVKRGKKRQKRLTKKVAKLKKELAKAERKLKKKCGSQGGSQCAVGKGDAIFGSDGFLDPVAKVIEEVPCAKELCEDVKNFEGVTNNSEGFQTLLEMGFAPERIQNALDSSGGDIGKCIMELTHNK